MQLISPNVSLLNTDTKILAKVLSRRLEGVLPSIISPDHPILLEIVIPFLKSGAFLLSFIAPAHPVYHLMLKRHLTGWGGPIPLKHWRGLDSAPSIYHGSKFYTHHH